MIKNYKELDRLDCDQDTLLALASYDWFLFNDNRINRLKDDYKIKANNNDIFHYYHGNSELSIEMNNKRYINHYKKMLNSLI